MAKNNPDRSRRSRKERGPSPFKRKRMEAQGIDPDSLAVQDWLKSERNALMCIVRPLHSGAISRSMGFVYDTLPSGHHVVCTARHNFAEDENLVNYRFFHGSPERTSASAAHTTPIFAPDEHDVAFFVVQPSGRPIQVLDSSHYDKWVPHRDTTLFNAKNSIGEHQALPAFVMRQAVSPRGKERAYVRFMDPNADFLEPSSQKATELLEAGAHELGLMRMVSRPGCSGSPIWDPKLRLVGVDVRGTEGGDRGDYVGYVYAADVQACYASVREQLDAIVGSL